MAYSSSECACDADWTPQEVYDLRELNRRQAATIERLTLALELIKQHQAGKSMKEYSTTWLMANKALAQLSEEG